MRNITLITVALLFFIAGCAQEKVNTDSAKEMPVKVQTELPQTNFDNYFTTSGSVQANQSAQLSTRVMGFIKKIHAEVGDQLRAGQLAVSIQNTDLNAQRAQATAQIEAAKIALQNAEKDYNRFKVLFDQNSATEKELDDMRAQFNSAKARMATAQAVMQEVDAQYQYVEIRAPFSGVVTQKMAEEGDVAKAGHPILTMESTGDFEVHTLVPESRINEVELNTTAKIEITSSGQTVVGWVVQISPGTHNGSGQFTVKLSVEKNELPLRSGMYTKVSFPAKDHREVLLIPEKALIEKGDLKGVYTISHQNTAMLRWLRLGNSYGDQIEVLSGLTAEEPIIISAESRLYNGLKITQN